jgi:hypothetical protein
MQAKTLDDYLARYGGLIAAKTAEAFVPLHVPSRDKPWHVELERAPFGAQAHAMTAIAKAWDKRKSIMLIAEMGTGKTLMGIAAAHMHARGKPYRAIVMAPDHLPKKWCREIQETIPGATTRIIKTWKDVVRMTTDPPTGSEWVVIGRNKAKLGAKWKAAYWKAKACFKWEGTRYQPETLRCPSCGAPLIKKIEEDGRTSFWEVAELDKTKRACRDCGGALWQYHGELRRWAPAQYIHKHRKNYFDYFVLDECHEEKGENTAQGLAAGSLAAACKRVIALTGTLIGGYAHHIRPLLFRLAPHSLVEEGLGWKDSTEFNRRYGRLDTIITQKDGTVVSNRQSRGSKRNKDEKVRPGVMPTLYGRHLIDNTVFLSLSEVAAGLPGLHEDAIAVPLPPDLEGAYKVVEDDLKEEVKRMMRKRNTRLLGTMLQTLLAYPDYPYDWKEIGYYDKDEDSGTMRWVGVTTPLNFPKSRSYDPKEMKLLEMVKEAKANGHQTWVYVQFTDKRPVPDRLLAMFEKHGIKAKWLKSSVQLAKREDWITEHGKDVDVVISHPKLVETGLDLFDKGGGHNFSTLIFYETGYALFTLRQAARRAWRIGQRRNCKTYYLYYQNTMQERAMELMGKKLTASLALEGQFSEEGLAAMTEDSGSVEMELAKSLSNNLEFGETQRVWEKAGQAARRSNVTPQSLRKARERLRKRRKSLTQANGNGQLPPPAPPGDDEELSAADRLRRRLKRRKVNCFAS